MPGNRVHAVFGGVIAQFEDAVAEVGTEALHVGNGLSDCSGQ